MTKSVLVRGVLALGFVAALGLACCESKSPPAPAPSKTSEPAKTPDAPKGGEPAKTPEKK